MDTADIAIIVTLAAGAVGWLLLRNPTARPRPSTHRVPARPQAALAGSTTQAAPAALNLKSIDVTSELNPLPVPAALQDARILAAAELPIAMLEEARRRLDAISVPSHAAQQLVSPALQDSAATKELTQLISHEPLLAAKIIARANSPFYGLATPIVSIQHAVTYLGMNAVRTMALQFALEQAFPLDDAGLKARVRRIFDTGTIAAQLCALLSPRLGIADVGAATTETVLFFLGDFAMIQLLPADKEADVWALGLIERSSSEQALTGINSGIAGRLLMEQWGLPENVIDDVEEMRKVAVAGYDDCLAENPTRIALGFTCALIGEAIMRGHITHPDQIDLYDESQPEFYNLRSYLDRAPLDRLQGLLSSTELRMPILRLITATSAATLH